MRHIAVDRSLDICRGILQAMCDISLNELTAHIKNQPPFYRIVIAYNGISMLFLIINN